MTDRGVKDGRRSLVVQVCKAVIRDNGNKQFSFLNT